MIDRKNISKYQVSMNVVVDLLDKELITREEFAVIEKALADLYGIKEGSLVRVGVVFRYKKL